MTRMSGISGSKETSWRPALSLENPVAKSLFGSRPGSIVGVVANLSAPERGLEGQSGRQSARAHTSEVLLNPSCNMNVDVEAMGKKFVSFSTSGQVFCHKPTHRLVAAWHHDNPRLSCLHMQVQCARTKQLFISGQYRILKFESCPANCSSLQSRDQVVHRTLN